MKTLARLFGMFLVVFAALGLHTWLIFSPGAPTYVLAAERRAEPLPVRLRNSSEHDSVRAAHEEPYVLELAQGDGALLYYGAHHSDDPDDPQLDDIRTRWKAFEPTVSLCEGRSRGFLLGPLYPKLVGMPEPAQVHALARADGVPIYSLEPDYGAEVELLLEHFEPADVALFFTLRVYWSESGGTSNESLAEDLRAKRTDVDGLRSALPHLTAMDTAWTRVGGSGDWRTWTGGMPEALSAIDHTSRAVRGEHMARVLIDLVEKGERVFAVVGSGHVIRQEWALRAALGAEPAADQPVGE